jgi:adenosylcobinamide-GDP ribazoletransferase
MTLVRGFLLAIAFLTRIPMPIRSELPRGAAGASIAFFPLVGLFLGLASAGAALLLRDRLHLPPHVLWAAGLVALQALLTGALHLDGLSDIVDGLGGSRGDRERALEIMKDSRVGAFGVVALVLLLVGKIVVLDEALRTPEAIRMLIAYPVAARFSASLLVFAFPCARATGMARTFHDESGWPMALAATVFAGGAFWFLGPATWIPGAVALGTGLAAGGYIALRLRGLTGDAYGTAIELAELAFLAAAAYPRLRGA